MKTIMSALVAVSVLGGIAAPASGAQQEQNSLWTQEVQKVAWTDQDQKAFWAQQEDRGGG